MWSGKHHMFIYMEQSNRTHLTTDSIVNQGKLYSMPWPPNIDQNLVRNFESPKRCGLHLRRMKTILRPSNGIEKLGSTQRGQQTCEHLSYLISSVSWINSFPKDNQQLTKFISLQTGALCCTSVNKVYLQNVI